LVRGIFRRWSELLGDGAVAYFTAADFGRELRAARSENNLNDFRRRLSELKLLVVEDIHRLAESAFIQRELRDTLDVLSEAGSVVVLTARQLPALQSRLEFGLRDRLSSGLTLHLRYPGQEAREELLKLAAQTRGLPLSAARRHALAQRVSGPAPRLFSVLTQQALRSCKGNSQEDGGVSKDNWPSFEQGLDLKPIVALVARYFSLTQAALCSPGRRKSLVYARGIAIYLARSHTKLSYALIGKGLGNRDHTTVMNALKNIEKLLATDSATQRTIDKLRRILCAT
jgi:chromosomal replication initiator protein